MKRRQVYILLIVSAMAHFSPAFFNGPNTIPTSFGFDPAQSLGAQEIEAPKTVLYNQTPMPQVPLNKNLFGADIPFTNGNRPSLPSTDLAQMGANYQKQLENNAKVNIAPQPVWRSAFSKEQIQDSNDAFKEFGSIINSNAYKKAQEKPLEALLGNSTIGGNGEITAKSKIDFDTRKKFFTPRPAPVLKYNISTEGQTVI